MIASKIVADSISPKGERLTSFVLTMPRIVLAELNTHRAFTRNSASSRAIKFEKMVDAIRKTPFIPIKWMKDHKGMQGYEYFTTETAKDAWLHLDRAWGYESNANQLATDVLQKEWLEARDSAIMSAERLSLLGLTKQVVNRLLEPFMYHTVIVTATEYENFFALRAHPDAEIHIQDLAYKMLTDYNSSEPNRLNYGQWHIPFGDDINRGKLRAVLEKMYPMADILDIDMEIAMVKIATARCAGVSYTVIGEDGNVEDYEKLIIRHDKLSKSGHWSPFEHCAKVMDEEYSDSAAIRPGEPKYPDRWCGNFRGFIQYRKMFENENKKDERVRRHIIKS